VTVWRRWGPAARRPLVVAVLVAATFALAAAALGGGGRAPATGRLPACAAARGRLALPAALAGFPLPPGSVIDRRELKYGYAIYSGHVPGSINPVRDFLVSRLPRAGYRLGAGDAEAAEAEAAYAGHGVHGRWKVRSVYSCPGALTIRIAVR
jgi:hypothetical protein